MKEIKKNFESNGITVAEIYREDHIFIAMCAAVWVSWIQESLLPVFKNLSCCISIAQFAVLVIMAVTNNFAFGNVLLCCAIVFGLHIFLSLISCIVSALASLFINKCCKCYLVDEAVSKLPYQTIHMHELSEDVEAPTVLLGFNKRCYSISLSSVKKLAGESDHAKE